MGYRGRRRGGGCGGSFAARMLPLEHTRACLCLGEGKAPRGPPHRIWESPAPSPPPNPAPRPQNTVRARPGRAGPPREQHLLGTRPPGAGLRRQAGPAGSASASGPPRPRSPLSHTRAAQRIPLGWRPRLRSRGGQPHHENLENPTPLAARLGFPFGAPDGTSEARNLKIFLPLLGQGTLEGKDEAAAAESCVSS